MADGTRKKTARKMESLLRTHTGFKVTRRKPMSHDEMTAVVETLQRSDEFKVVSLEQPAYIPFGIKGMAKWVQFTRKDEDHSNEYVLLLTQFTQICREDGASFDDI